MSEQNWLAGRRTLIVGAGSGIGRAVLNRFLAEGSRVAVLERDEEKASAIRRELPEVVVTVGDAATRDANESAVASAVDAFGGLDALVQCVGIFDFYRGVADIEADQLDAAFDEIFHTNVKSHLHSVKAALPWLRESRGSVVLTESTSGYYPGRGGILYVPSKFAVRGLVLALAHELAPDVRVNGVAPGGTVGTDLRGAGSLGMASRSLGSTPNRAEEIAARVPLNVALAGEDHAWSYVFLVSERSRGVSGDVIHTDGGMVAKG